jgi:plasmid stabilization system protein ParE
LGHRPQPCRSLVEAADRLLTLPHWGRPLPDGRHSLDVLRPYVLVYRLWGAEARILAVWHAAQMHGEYP